VSVKQGFLLPEFATLAPVLQASPGEEVLSLTYQQRIKAIHKALGIPADYAQSRQLSLQPECEALVPAGKDIFERDQQMQAQTLQGWQAMCRAALADGIELQLVSAFRSVDYQVKLFEKKLAAGRSLAEILQVNAAPGYSEHHSGCALDLSCPGAECLEESFEQTEAFAWLQDRATGFDFHLSFPRNNPQGFLYEPWHWCYRQ
jgi:D-alanyl-D-alanine carboxypeptidase